MSGESYIWGSPYDGLVRPVWERGQSQASEPDRGLDRPLLQASPEARNLRPPQSPGHSI